MPFLTPFLISINNATCWAGAFTALRHLSYRVHDNAQSRSCRSYHWHTELCLALTDECKWGPRENRCSVEFKVTTAYYSLWKRTEENRRWRDEKYLLRIFCPDNKHDLSVFKMQICTVCGWAWWCCNLILLLKRRVEQWRCWTKELGNQYMFRTFKPRLWSRG